MQGPIERGAPKRLWKLAPPRPGAAAPLDPGWGRLRPQTPEKLRGKCGAEGAWASPGDAKGVRGASPRAANGSALETAFGGFQKAFGVWWVTEGK